MKTMTIRSCRAGVKAPGGVVRHCGRPARLAFKLPQRRLVCWYCAEHYAQTALHFAVNVPVEEAFGKGGAGAAC